MGADARLEAIVSDELVDWLVGDQNAPSQGILFAYESFVDATSGLRGPLFFVNHELVPESKSLEAAIEQLSLASPDLDVSIRTGYFERLSDPGVPFDHWLSSVDKLLSVAYRSPEKHFRYAILVQPESPEKQLLRVFELGDETGNAQKATEFTVNVVPRVHIEAYFKNELAMDSLSRTNIVNYAPCTPVVEDVGGEDDPAVVVEDSEVNIVPESDIGRVLSKAPDAEPLTQPPEPIATEEIGGAAVVPFPVKPESGDTLINHFGNDKPEETHAPTIVEGGEHRMPSVTPAEPAPIEAPVQEAPAETDVSSVLVEDDKSKASYTPKRVGFARRLLFASLFASLGGAAVFFARGAFGGEPESNTKANSEQYASDVKSNYQKEIDRVAADLKSLQGNLADARRLSDGRSDRIKSLEGEVERLLKDLAQRKSEFDSLDSASKKRSADYDTLEGQYKKILSENEELRKAKSSLESRVGVDRAIVSATYEFFINREEVRKYDAKLQVASELSFGVLNSKSSREDVLKMFSKLYSNNIASPDFISDTETRAIVFSKVVGIAASLPDGLSDKSVETVLSAYRSFRNKESFAPYDSRCVQSIEMAGISLLGKHD